MTTETVYTENIASLVSSTAGNLRDLFIDAAGDYEDDYDIDAAVREYADSLTSQLARLGITQVLVSGETRCPVNAEIDHDMVAEIVKSTSTDITDILINNSLKH